MALPALAQTLLSVLQKIPAFFSLVGSSMIISSVCRHKKNRKNTQQRIVGTMSCIDVCASFTWLTTNLWITESYPSFPNTVGNNVTCNIQGFVLQANTSSILYNASLSIYYVLVIKYNWKSRKVKKVEKWFHAGCLSFGLVTATTATALGLMHPANWNCWIAPDFSNPDDPNRNLAKTLQMCMFFIPLWISIVLCAVCMFVIYLHVKKTESSSLRFQSTVGNSSNRLRRTKEVAKQGKYFVGAFVVTWFFPSIVRFIQVMGYAAPSWLVVVAGTLVPSQGFFNAIVYFRLRFEKQTRDDPDRPKWRIIGRIIIANICPCWQKDQGLPVLHDCDPLSTNEDGHRSSRHGRASLFHEPEEILSGSRLGHGRIEVLRESRASQSELEMKMKDDKEELHTLELDSVSSANNTNTGPKKSKPLKSILRGSILRGSTQATEVHAAPTRGVGDWRALKAAGVHVVKEKDAYEDN